MRSDGRRTKVSATLANLLGAALDAAAQTDGDVDPTVGAALVALGYAATVAPPDAGEPLISSILTPAVWSMVKLEDGFVTVPPGVLLDLGATAKAVAADRCAARVRGATGSGVLINLGGDIATAGPSPTGGWQVVVHDADGEPETSLSLPAGAALATSSTLRRRWRCGDGSRAPHSGPADWAACGSGMAHRQRGRANLLRRQHGLHRRRRSRMAGTGMDSTALACRRGWSTVTGNVHRVGRWPRDESGGAPMTDQALWALGRGTGITALAFLTVSLALGIATRSGRRVATFPRFAVADVHRFAALAGTAAGRAAHEPAVLRPVRSIAIGRLRCALPRRISTVLAGDGNARARRACRGDPQQRVCATGWGCAPSASCTGPTYALWPIALAHALGNGTDAGRGGFWPFAGGCALTVAAALVWRLRIRLRRIRRGTPPMSVTGSPEPDRP